MVLGPPWRETPATNVLFDEETLLDAARAAGLTLVERLKRAEQQTRGWSNRELTQALVDTALSQCMAELAQTECWGPDNRMPSNEFWRVAGPLLEVGVLQWSARFKPHGYAGDYEMLERLCNDYCCDHPLGQAFDRYFQSQAAPQAVRARNQQAAAALAEHRLASPGPYQVVSVGSGPAVDVRTGLAMLPPEQRSDVSVTLLDLDPSALSYAKERLDSLLPGGVVRAEATNLYRLPKRANRATILGQPQLLVCSGFFDYLDDASAAAMLDLFWRQLADGGLLLVGNFAPHNPTRAYMEWIGNWYLTYRSVDAMEQLGQSAGISPPSLSVSAERLGVDLFLVARKHQSIRFN